MTQAEGRALSPLAAELARLLAQSRGKRVPVGELYDGASRYYPGLVGDSDGRARFRHALGELEAAGKITLPTDRSRTGWDTRALPAIPKWVIRAALTPAPRLKPTRRVWPRALEAAGRIATRADEQQMLERIATWMRDDPTPDLVPTEERSLELFDDEKAIDGYLKTRLFTSGALTLNMLACFAPPLPLVSQHVPGTGPTHLLVLENLATYTSFLTALRQLDPFIRPDLHVGMGNGNAFAQSVLSIPMLDPLPTRTYYFGDLDLAGLQTATKAAAHAEAAGLPTVRPAESCYQFLLDGPPQWRSTDGSNRHSAPDYAAACRWLPHALQAQAVDLLQARQRVPQERLGLRALSQTPWLWAKLCHPHDGALAAVQHLGVGFGGSQGGEHRAYQPPEAGFPPRRG